MKIIVYLFILVSSSLYGQYDFDDCPLDSTMNLVLICSFFDPKPESDSIFFDVFVRSVKNENCQPYKYDWKENWVIDGLGEKLFKCSKDQIIQLNIELSNQYAYGYVFPLDKFESLNSIELPSLKHFSIISDGYYTMNFNEWKMYSVLLETQSLETINIKGKAINEDWLAPFESYKNLKEINIPDYVYFPLDIFPELKRFNMTNAYFFFAHYLVDSPDLLEMPSYYAQEYNCNDLYPEMTFFCNETSPIIIGHPFYEINKIIKTKLQDHQEYSGSMVITRSEVNDDFVNKKNGKDTVAVGAVSNGQPIGKWNFILPHFQVFGSPRLYYYYYNERVKLVYPKNGLWNYYYDNDILAISGQFKDGKKNGKWKFYDPDGKLTSVKSFEYNEPKGLFINYQPFEETFKENRDYIDGNFILIGREGIDDTYFVCNGYGSYHSENKYSLNEYGKLRKFKDGILIKEIRNDSWKYNKILKNYLRKLYPDKRLEIKNLKFLK